MQHYYLGLRSAESRTVAGRLRGEWLGWSRVKSRLCDIGMPRCRGGATALVGFLCLPRPAPPSPETQRVDRDPDVTARPHSFWPLAAASRRARGLYPRLRLR